MPRGRRYTNSELRGYCHKYIKYLDDLQLTSDMVTKEKLRDTYRRDYKPNVNEHTPSFATVLYNMKRFSMVTMRDKEYVKFLGKYKKGNVSLSDISSQQSTPSEKSNKSPTKSPAKSPRVSVSVDQHVAMRQIKTVAIGGLGDSIKPFPSNKLLCNVCNVRLTSVISMDEHKLGKKHVANCLKFLVDLKKPTYTSNNYGIVVTADGTTLNEEEGKLELQLIQGQTKRLNLEVRNQGEQTVSLIQCDMLQNHKTCTLDDPKGITVGSKTFEQLSPGQSYGILVTCSVQYVGYNIIPIVFGFTVEVKESKKRFFVLQQLVLVTETELMKELQPTSSYKAPPRAAIKVEGEVEPGLKIGSDHVLDELKQVIALKHFNIPPTLQTLTNHGLKLFNGMTRDQKQQLEKILDLLESNLSADNHCHRFQVLLHLEEIQMNVDIRQYDMKGVEMMEIQDKPHLLSLEVPGLAENRPSVLVGDRLFVHDVNSIGNKEYEGWVHAVRETQVWLGFNKSFRNRFLKGMSFNVRFTFSRRPLRLQHRGLSLAQELALSNLLFPKPSLNGTKSSCKLLLFNRLLESNTRQLQAVESILSRTSLPAPYLIFGPPGTGKTVTIIEAMMQVWKKYPESHILACAASNSAADLLTERLLVVVPPSQILRMVALSRTWSAIPEQIKGCCNYDKDARKYVYPSQEKIMTYSFVITTLVTAGRLVSAAFTPSHFSHVFIDEAGHACEPETLIAVAGILSPSGSNPCGQLVMAGDPKQLGPILRSPCAIKYRLDMSYLERLMTTCDLYKRGDNVDTDRDDDQNYNPNVITKLLCNYRSSPAILQIPNELFYDNELQPCADMLHREVYAQWEKLPSKGFPILFHGVLGKDEREAQSPSFFNVAEVQIVVGYVQDLLSTRSNGIKIMPKDIGIISPYNQQVRKIRQALQKISSTPAKLKELQNKDPKKVKVASTEEYQGQERTVIIISTVRSNPDLLQMDSKFRLGFLRNPKRFNVALTRAKALLIVVGNPHILKLDDNWNRFLEFCLEHKGYAGIPFNPSEDDEDLIERMKRLQMDEDFAAATIESMLPFSNEQRWRTEV